MSTDCGIGSDGSYTGPCSGTLTPADAGQGVFSALSASSPIHAIVGAGGLIAALLLALFLTRVVGAFFGSKKKPPMQREEAFACPACDALVEDDGAGLFTCDECGFACRDPEPIKQEKFSTVAKRHAREVRNRRVAEHRAAAAAANDLDIADDEELDREDDSQDDEDDHQQDSPGAPEKFQ